MTKAASTLRILNYGGGAVGMGLDSFLLKTGAQVVIVARPRTVSELRANGLVRVGIFGKHRTAPAKLAAFSSLEEVPVQKFDYFLVSTKSFDSEAAAKDIAAHQKFLDKTTKIVLCQNGWGNAEIFAEYFPKKQIFNARIITGFERPQPNEVNITVHADAIHLGSIFGNDPQVLTPLAQALSLGGIPAALVSDVTRDLWAKMLYNCALNPLGAICDVPYGELGKNEFSHKLMREIMEEIFGVMTAAKYQTHWPTVEEYEKIFYGKFLPPTAGHRSSTLQDLKAGKKTEIDALNGMIVRMGKRFKVAVPANRTIYQMIKFLESKDLN